jgi:hypothetical protein
MIFSHVRCNDCGTAYNGKTGDYNTTPIIIFYTIGGIGLLLGIIGLILEAMVH